MMRVLVCAFMAAAVVTVAAQQPPPIGALPSSPPADRPVRLIAAQQLALAAYPEIRTRGLQLRVDDTDGAKITIGFAEPDRDTLLALSRPRAAALVLDATFDADQRLTRAVLRGTLAHTKERRELRARASGWSEALEQARAAFPPSKQGAFVQQLDRDLLHGIVGRLTTPTATFQTGTAEDGLYWEVAATSETGQAIALGFEPYAGRLIKFVRGGGQ